MEMHFKPALNDTDLLSGSTEAVWGSYLGARALFQINTRTVGVNSSPPSAAVDIGTIWAWCVTDSWNGLSGKGP